MARGHRLNIRIPDHLMSWVKDYARDNNTTVTQVIVDHFTKLKQGKEVRDGRTQQA